MDTVLIQTTVQRVLEGSASFPEAVAAFQTAGVEYYHVDYLGRRKSYHDGAGALAVAPLAYEDLPAVAAEFDPLALKAAILDSQRNGQPYHAFSRRAMQAGVQGYYVFLRRRRVTYFGRQGDIHTEWFPGAVPLAVQAAKPPAQ